MAIKTLNEITTAFISFIYRRNKAIDFKPGTVVRDVLIDPPANEIAKLYAAIDRVQKIQSLANADIMTDQEMDDFGRNYNLKRKTGTYSTGYVTFATPRVIQADITIQQGTYVSAITDTGKRLQYITTASITMYKDRLDAYFNPVNNNYEITAPVRSVQTGSDTNRGAGTIQSVDSTISSTISFKVTNTETISGGTDAESNLAFADRIALAITGNNVGTAAGYKATALSLPGVTDAYVVDAGHPMMHRDMNSRGENIGGRVDVYINGAVIAEAQDTVQFQYKKSTDIETVVLSPSKLEFAIDDSNLEKHPIMQLNAVKLRVENPLFDIANQLTDDTEEEPTIVVSIVSPLDGNTISDGCTIQIRSYKPNGAIKQVDLQFNGLETKYRARFNNSSGFFEYQLDTTSLPDELLEISATSTDELGLYRRSSPITVTIDNAADIATKILEPDPGDTVSGMITIVAYARSQNRIPPDGVEIRFNGSSYIPMLQETNCRYTAQFNTCSVLNGPLKIEVRVTDRANHVASAMPIYLIVNNSRDLVSFGRVNSVALDENNPFVEPDCCQPDVSRCKPMRVWAGTSSCSVSTSDTNGRTWINRALLPVCGADEATVVYVDGTTIWAGTRGYGLFRGTFNSTTGEFAWERNFKQYDPETFLSNYINDILRVGNTLFVATNDGLMMTQDLGNTWSSITSGMLMPDTGHTFPTNYLLTLASACRPCP